MPARRRTTAPLDPAEAVRADATVAAYEAYYGQHGAPHPGSFPAAAATAGRQRQRLAERAEVLGAYSC